MKSLNKPKPTCLNLSLCCFAHTHTHSMNWLAHVKGACHLDLMLCMKEEALPEVSAVLLQGIQCGSRSDSAGQQFSCFCACFA